MANLSITEHQQNGDGQRTWHSRYVYIGPVNGLHEFRDEDGKPEFFAKRKSVAGWHLQRGAWAYEFVTSKRP